MRSTRRAATDERQGRTRNDPWRSILAKDGHRKVVYSKDVIVSAGALNSPQLLELSGIGDSNNLRSMGIEPKVHLLGFGENLQDHSNVGISFESKNPTFDSFRDPDVIGAVIEEYQKSKTGPLALSTLSRHTFPVWSC
jgi:choline dehydrogenase-like flavoprotein